MATSTSTPSLSFFSSSLFTTTKPNSFSFKPNSLSLKKPQNTLTFSVNSQLTPLPILDFSGEKIGETFLNLKTAPPETARAVVHRAVVHHLQNRRRGTASTLTRAEVRGGGVKPFPQKKTGRARRGSQRTPLRPGGGVVFGPKPKDWSIKMNKKEKRLALSTALQSAVESAGAGVVVEGLGSGFEKPKTSEFIGAMKRWGLDPKEKAVFFMMEVEENVEKSGRNIGTVRMLTPRSLNIYDVLNSDKLVFSKDAVDYLNAMYGADYEGEDDDEDDEDEEEFEEVEGDVGDEDETPEAA
ncbi:large ribosomal subunit protein uL4c-like [Silene latifolia]|uniref:large ribosomal subunit protein uL4c-like n=1 Tax=Silene latifolia TaxID=37657 RepID=UPI003D77469B